MDKKTITSSIQHWIESFIVGLNLCPFAKHPVKNDSIRFSVTDATTEQQLIQALQSELELLTKDKTVETSLLIHPNVLQDFYDYNEFLDVADSLLMDLELNGIIQIASFHPEYQFAETDPNDIENYTNRSPFPLLHLLREDSVAKAIASYSQPDKIPERNIALLNDLGIDKINTLYQSHFKINEEM